MKKWNPITKDEYFKILKKYKSKLAVFSCATQSDYIMTEWGIKGADTPCIKAVDQLRFDECSESWNYSYYKFTANN